MTLSDVVDLAYELLLKHNLPDWKFAWDRAFRRAGCCDYRRKTITLSKHYVLLNADKPADIKNTLLHEIAHALAPGHGHNYYWKKVCCQIGARPERCYDSSRIVMPQGKYQATCPTCGKKFYRHRKVPGWRIIWCIKCGKEKGLLQYIPVGYLKAAYYANSQQRNGWVAADEDNHHV